MERPYISVVAIAKNEEAVIERYINSIKDNLGPKVEIVVVDTGSTDKTVEIARSLGAVVYEEGEKFAHVVSEEEERFINSKFNDNVVKQGQKLFFYSDARNCADQHAKGEWLVSIDCHWIITKGKDLEKKLRSLPAEVSNCAYTCTIAINEGTKTAFSTTRVYRRNHGCWNFRIHEVYSSKIGRIINIEELATAKISGGARNYLPHLAYHYYFGNFDPKGSEYARMLFYFSREVYYNRSKYPNLALNLLKLCAANSTNWHKERSQAAVFIADAVEDLNIKRENLIYAITLNPIWREPYLLLSDLAYRQCDWAGCIGYAEQALKVVKQEDSLHAERDCNYTTEPYRLIYVALIQMARICRMNNYIDRSIDKIQYALEIENKTGCDSNVFIWLWVEGYRSYTRKGDRAKAKKMFRLCNEAKPDKYKTEDDIK